MSRTIDVDFSQLMDLRIDYAFKLFFATGDTSWLISLLNAIFANKDIPRIIDALTVVNPYLERVIDKDKMSVLDIRAILSDGSTVSVEMHLYGLTEFKYKSLRSWAKLYGEGLESGQKYTDQKPVICVSFIDGPVTDSVGCPIEKVHALFYAMERDDHRILLPNMELHYINMRAFVDGLRNKKGTACEAGDMFTKWLMLITQKEIADKEALRRMCEEEEVLYMAVETLARLSEDKIKRYEYQRRLDELHSYNLLLADVVRAEESVRQAKESERQAKESERQAKESERQANESLSSSAKFLLRKNYSVAEIAEAMNLPEQKVKELLQTD